MPRTIKLVHIDVEDCQYYLPYEKGWDYSDEGGDCDHMNGPGTCTPNKCPINRFRYFDDELFKHDSSEEKGDI